MRRAEGDGRHGQGGPGGGRRRQVGGGTARRRPAHRGGDGRRAGTRAVRLDGGGRRIRGDRPRRHDQGMQRDAGRRHQRLAGHGDPAPVRCRRVADRDDGRGGDDRSVRPRARRAGAGKGRVARRGARARMPSGPRGYLPVAGRRSPRRGDGPGRRADRGDGGGDGPPPGRQARDGGRPVADGDGNHDRGCDGADRRPRRRTVPGGGVERARAGRRGPRAAGIEDRAVVDDGRGAGDLAQHRDRRREAGRLVLHGGPRTWHRSWTRAARTKTTGRGRDPRGDWIPETPGITGEAAHRSGMGGTRRRGKRRAHPGERPVGSRFASRPRRHRPWTPGSRAGPSARTGPPRRPSRSPTARGSTRPPGSRRRWRRSNTRCRRIA